MGRTPTFDRTEVVRAAAAAFLDTGYEGTSVDDLVRCTGLHRGSLYQAFGSKRGLFVTALRELDHPPTPAALDLLLVATLELAPRDDEVRGLVADVLARFDDPATVLGGRLLARAHLEKGPQ
ncbi:TetR/AcrR family transcriptional regulator [Nakamurella deserti]|uniref:TetR/AcrR family transcriptional regulator n=1 Tax=Nakamurella deserti TaxID=2164074 RepID=UPI000DBE143A|nr:helix-turn-helix domain-containing protein [Nakamurella deserti]